MSIYTYHLIEALQGKANQPGDTKVMLSNIMNHLGKTVPESAKTQYQAEQTPFFDTAAEDFPVALLCGGKGLSKFTTTSNLPPEIMTDSELLTPALEMALRSLQILEEQAAAFGALYIPPPLQIQLEEQRRKVAELEARLNQSR
jgi:hypothetical protein